MNISLFNSGHFLELKGKWGAGSSTATYHSSLLEAKQYCLAQGNCFGIEVDVIKNKSYSIEFPVWIKSGEDFYVHQKEPSLGICFDNKRLTSICL